MKRVKYNQFTIADRKKNKEITYYTDNKVDSRDISRFAYSLSDEKLRGGVHRFELVIQKGTDNPKGKYIKPAVIEKGSKNYGIRLKKHGF